MSIQLLLERYPVLVFIKIKLEAACALLERTVSSGGKILVCGNGGVIPPKDQG